MKALAAFIQRPRRVFFINFLAGAARGFGFAIGFTILAGIAFLILGRLVDAPVIGRFIARVMETVEEQRGLFPIR
jgi:hypothetical protein